MNYGPPDDEKLNYSILQNHGNANISLNAASGDLCLGWKYTTHIYMYYSPTDDSNTRKKYFEINSNGAMANSTLGVNGQNTSYTLYVNGTTTITGVTSITDTTDATSSEGALKVSGGVRINKKLNVGTNTDIGGNLTVTGTSKLLSYVGIGTDPNTSYNLYVNGTTYLNGATTITGITSITNVTDATSSTGALVVSGGARIAQKINVGSDADIGGNASISGNLTVTGTSKLTSYVGIGTNPNTSYNLYVNGTSYHNGNDTHAGNILVSTNDSYDLGATDKRWKDIYLTDAVIVGSTSYIANSSTTNGTYIEAGDLTISRADTSGGLRIKSNGIAAAHLFVASSGKTAGTEGITQLSLGNSNASSAANNYSAKLVFYNSNGSFSALLGKYGAVNGTNRDYISFGYLKGTQIESTSGFVGSLTGNVTGNLTGNVTGNLTGNVTGDVTGNLTGNASTATKLKTARTLYVYLNNTHDTNAPVQFDGSADKALLVSGVLKVAHGGTGHSSWTSNRIFYASDGTTFGQIAAPSAGDTVLRWTGSAYSWLSYTANNTGSTIVYRNASGNFAAGTITATLSGKASTAGTADKANAVAWTNVSGRPTIPTLTFGTVSGTASFNITAGGTVTVTPQITASNGYSLTKAVVRVHVTPQTQPTFIWNINGDSHNVSLKSMGTAAMKGTVTLVILQYKYA